MMSLWIGLCGLIAVIALSAGQGSLSTYIQMHSLVMVVGGTVCVYFFLSPMSVIRGLMASLKGLVRPDEEFAHHQASLIALTKNRHAGSTSGHPLIAYAADLWTQGLDQDLVVVLLSQRRRELESRETDPVQSLKSLSKYPPALGMIGTVMGMVALFAALDKNRDSIGYHLSMAMTATFLGLILTNGLISPLADRLHLKQLKHRRTLDGIYEILLLINRGEAATLIQEELRDRAA